MTPITTDRYFELIDPFLSTRAGGEGYSELMDASTVINPAETIQLPEYSTELYESPSNWPSVYVLDIDFNPVGEDRLSILADGLKLQNEDGSYDVIAGAVFSVFHVMSVSDSGIEYLDTGDYMSDQILLNTYDQEFNFFQIDEDLSEHFDGVRIYENNSALPRTPEEEFGEERLLISIQALPLPDAYPGAQNERLLITTGLPNGQRAENWGSNWLETVLADSTPEEQAIFDVLDETSNNPMGPFEWLSSDEQTILRTHTVNSAPNSIFGIASGDWEISSSVQKTSDFESLQSGSGGIKGWLETGKAFMQEAFFAIGEYLPDQLSRQLLFKNVSTLKQAEDIKKAVEDSANSSVDVFNELLDADFSNNSRNWQDSSDKMDDLGKSIQHNLLESLGSVGKYLSNAIKNSVQVVEHSEDTSANYSVFVQKDGTEIRFIQHPENKSTGTISETTITKSYIALGSVNNDNIITDAGQDRIYGDSGDDDIETGDGKDIVFGGIGQDSLNGGNGDDALIGGSGNDVLFGSGGHDYVLGGDGADTLNGGDGDDQIIGGLNTADLRDVIYAGAGSDNVDGGYGNDLIYGMDGDDIIAGGFGSDELQGQNGNDVITGSALSDEVFGGAGNDFVNGGFGHDRINGGTGADKFYHLGISDHGSDWVQDFTNAEGDVLLFGNASASASDFQINYNHTANAAGERSGDDNVQEAFVIYKPTGQIIWALVDGAGESSIQIEIGGTVTDLVV